MDFVEKKEKLADLIEEYLKDNEKEAELLNFVNESSNDFDFKDKELFLNIFNELQKFLPELSQKELKQRVLMIRGFTF